MFQQLRIFRTSGGKRGGVEVKHVKTWFQVELIVDPKRARGIEQRKSHGEKEVADVFSASEREKNRKVRRESASECVREKESLG